MTNASTFGLGALLLGALAACQPSDDQSATAAAAVIRADSAWAQAFSQRDTTAYLSFVDSVAAVQPPNAATVSGQSAIRALAASYWALPGLTGTWHPVTAHASRSGDVAYSIGTYEISWDDPVQHHQTERGKYLYVWRNRAGHWKMVVESFSSDAPPPVPASH